MRRRWAGVTGMVLAMVALTATICAEHVGICAFAVAAIAWQTFVIVFAVLLLTGSLLLFVPDGKWSKSA